MKIKLTKPIEAHAETLHELNFREELTGEDITACGLPYVMVMPKESDEEGEVEISFQPHAIARYISRLAKIPPSSVKQLSAKDWQAAMTAILGFLGGSAQVQSLKELGKSS